MTNQLTFETLRDAVSGNATAFRSRTILQPAGGEGDKVFPPTYAGGVYAVEKRRLPGREEPIDCVLLDSVQSQANRMEEALQQAIDTGRLTIPVIEVDFTNGDLLSEIGKVTSLQAPHRIADAILRDSLVTKDDKGKTLDKPLPFRQSALGKRLDTVSLANATPLYELCPLALVFGMWDSTGPKGGLGAKFQRAMVSEIVGIDAVFGLRTASRIDPIIAKNPNLFETPDGQWTAVEANAARKQDKPIKFKKKLSELNLGNVTPDFARYDKSITSQNRQTPDPLRDDGGFIEKGRIRPGGVTVRFAEQVVILSLPALRRLQFPMGGGKVDPQVNDAGRTVLAALGLCAAALAAEKGFDLRSRCLLWPNELLTWELLGKPGEKPVQVALDSDSAIALLKEAVVAAGKVGLTWRENPLVLDPAPQLLALVKKSQEMASAQGGDAEGAD